MEAKAHEGEFDWNGKRLSENCSKNSLENHEQIGLAIKEASGSLDSVIKGVKISRGSHYQLANRIAYSWKLASMGIPVLLVYLGFTGDKGIADIGQPFRGSEHWKADMGKYTRGILPQGFFDRWLPCDQSQMCMIVRSKRVNELSPA